MKRTVWAFPFNSRIKLLALIHCFVKFVISVVQDMQQRANTNSEKTRAQPRCSTCKNPMKGHKNIKDCPRNRIEEQ